MNKKKLVIVDHGRGGRQSFMVQGSQNMMSPPVDAGSQEVNNFY